MGVHEHPASSSALQRALNASLPYSVNLVYRTQHHNQTNDAHIIATFSSSAKSIPGCWAAAYLDRAMRPETELWVFAAGEQPNHSTSEGFCPGCRKAILLLLDYMSTLPIPDLHPDNIAALELAKQHERQHREPRPDGSYNLCPGAYMRHLLLPHVLTVGACHQAIMSIYHEVGVVRTEFPGPNATLNKFLFTVADLPSTGALPPSLRWGEVREQDIDLVKVRTSIPRSSRTLLSLRSVGVFHKSTDEPVAWAFLGLDGSLTSLHTEEEYRGKGIAKAVAARIFRQYAPGLAVDKDGNAWSHADVYTDNLQSEMVCKSLGGKATWKCFWLRIDLQRAGSLAQHG